MTYLGAYLEPIVAEKPPNGTFILATLHLIDQQRTLVNRLRAELQRNTTEGCLISGPLLESLLSVTQSLQMANFAVVELIVATLLDKETSLTESRVFEMLKVYAPKEKNAAYECALAYLGMGRFKQQLNCVAAQYLYDAIKLGHQDAFFTMLDAINDNYLKISGDNFLSHCKKLVAETNNLEVAIALGTLLCGFDIEDHGNLRSKLKLYDPNIGFNYLRFVQVHARLKGEHYLEGKEADYYKELSNVAFLTISKGYQQNIYTSEVALKYKTRLTLIIPIEDSSTTPRLL